MRKKWLREHFRRHSSRVRALFLNEHLSNSERHLRAAIRREPRDYALRSALTDLLHRGGRGQEALRVWRETVRAFPRAANPYFQRAIWAMEQRDFQAAEKYLRLCLVRDRGYFKETAHFWRAECLYRLGRFDKSRLELAQVSADYEEAYFLEHDRWSKSDLLEKLNAKCAAPAV